MSKKIISHIFNYAAREGAHGLVIESAPKKIDLRYHFSDGEERSFGLPKKLEKDLSLALRQLLSIAPDELATKKYCKIEDKNYRLTFHLTILPALNGEKIIINILPKNNKLFRLEQLGLQKNHLKIIKATLAKRSGLILLSSPHGQGKSTTLYSLLQKLNTPDRCIYFLGSKLEHPLEGINNLAATKNNWAKVLQTDSDIIITDIKTEDDLKNATAAAATGRLILGTIIANSAWEVLAGYLKVKMPLKLKLDSLKLIINQRVTDLTRTKKRRTIGLFETLELTPNLKKCLLETKLETEKEKFWEKLGRLALKDGYEPLSFDRQKKIKNGLLKDE